MLLEMMVGPGASRAVRLLTARARVGPAGRTTDNGAGELRALTEDLKLTPEVRERFAAEARGVKETEVQIGEKDECRGKCRNELANSDHSSIRHGSPVVMILNLN